MDRATADTVARHLVAAGELLDDDPEAALAHAQAARARSGRIAAVREAVGIAAYQCGDWAQALAELRAARRMGSKSQLLPLIADCERGVGRPERAIELGAQPRGRRAHRRRRRRDCASSLAGARADLGQLEQALAMLSSPAARPGADRRRPRRGCSTPTPRRCWRSAATTKRCSGSSMPLPPTSTASPTPKTGSASWPDVTTLAQQHDCLLLDLDGTVFRGHEPTEGAVDALDRGRHPQAVRHQQRLPRRRGGRAAPSRARFHRHRRRRRHQRPERRGPARRATARRGAGARSSAPTRWPRRSPPSG